MYIYICIYIYMKVSWIRGTPCHHPFIDGLSLINQPAIGGTPILTPQHFSALWSHRPWPPLASARHPARWSWAVAMQAGGRPRFRCRRRSARCQKNLGLSMQVPQKWMVSTEIPIQTDDLFFGTPILGNHHMGKSGIENYWTKNVWETMISPKIWESWDLNIKRIGQNHQTLYWTIRIYVCIYIHIHFV